MKYPSTDYEVSVWASGGLACGIDEVGRGCVAGPVVAAAVIMPAGHKPLEHVRDSKKLTVKKREELFYEILDSCADFGVGLLSAAEIDRIGIVDSVRGAMSEAVSSLVLTPDLLLIDAMKIEGIPITQKSIIKGDESVYSIACASIVAKVYRDRVVMGLDNVHPNHEFSSHKGYGTKKHFENIREHGMTEEHRKSFLKNRVK
ncbi:MAG: ribonuclease HII [Patescibacteria group bacterium]|nr:ribonuclease HII [Patescibacteria group bacterium]